MCIQKYRYGERICLKWELSEEVLGCMVPVFTLQLAVEECNEAWTGDKSWSRHYPNLRRPDIGTYAEDFVEDNRSGIAEEKLAEINKMLHERTEEYPQNVYDRKGLRNLNERLKQQFGQAYGVELKNNAGEGAVLIIYIP